MKWSKKTEQHQHHSHAHCTAPPRPRQQENVLENRDLALDVLVGHIGGLAREDELDRHLRAKVGALVDAAEVALGDLHTELDVRLRDLPIRIWYAPLSQHLSFHLYEEEEEVESILVFTNR